jgi:uncharacterized protein (DUF58 family)
LEPLDASTLAKLNGVKLRARAVMEGVLSGLHKSPHQGQSVEFSEHKEYAPGDELRHLDWKAYGKLDRYYVKRFEHETNLKATLVLDGSASMGYRNGAALSKLEVATTLAGALAYLLVRQQDATGLSVVTREGFADVPHRAAAGHLHTVLGALESVRRPAAPISSPSPSTSPSGCAGAGWCWCSRTSSTTGTRPWAGCWPPRAAERRGHLHVLDPAEAGVPFHDPTLFLSMEDERRLEVNAREIRQSYLEEFEAFLARTRAACTEADVDYTLVRTDEPLDAVLLRFLGRRQAKA